MVGDVVTISDYFINTYSLKCMSFHVVFVFFIRINLYKVMLSCVKTHLWNILVTKV